MRSKWFLGELLVGKRENERAGSDRSTFTEPLVRSANAMEFHTVSARTMSIWF
jgi:hypothetical protein